MSGYSEIEQARKKRNRKRLFRRVMAIFIVAVVALIAIVVVQRSGGWFSDLFGSISAIIHPGPGYPVEIQSDRIEQMFCMSSDLVVLTDTNLSTYSKTAGEKLNEQHYYANPIVLLKDRRLLLIDRGGTKASVYSVTKKLHEWQLSDTIYLGEISSKGEVALVTSAQDYVSKVAVYNTKYEERFAIYSSDRYIVDVCLSDNGKRLGIGSVNTVNGTIQSTFSVYDTTSDQAEPLCAVTMDNEIILSVEYLSSGDIMVITDTQAAVYSDKGVQKGSYAYDGGKIAQFSFDMEKHMTLVLKYNEDSTSEYEKVVLLDQTATPVAETQVSDTIKKISCKNNRIHLLVDNKLLIYDYNMKLFSEVSLEGAWNFASSSSVVYYATSKEIYKKDI